MLPQYLPRLKAPRHDGELLACPPLDQVAELLDANRARLDAPLTILDQSLTDLRVQARREIAAAAARYLQDAGEPTPACLGTELPSRPWLIAGHQPEFFHPGVWVKNFILHRLARRHDAMPLNVVVDNDTLKHPYFRVPAGPHVARVPFDRWQSEAPFEERSVLEEGIFWSTPQRLRVHSSRWPFQPWIDDIWTRMKQVIAPTPLLGERIVRARRSLERDIGLEPVEVPLSAVCQTTTFARFVAAMLDDLPRFHADYNAAAGDYRTHHGLRSVNHPVPDLGRRGVARETPLWVLHRGDGRRQRLFAVRDRDRIVLLAGERELARFDGGPQRWATDWPRLEAAGIKIRTRALTTTLFCRLFVGDLFLHGIGGGKYDEVTDSLMRRFFGLVPPAYLVATATLRLPLPVHADSARHLAERRRVERDLWYNPQRHLQRFGPEAAARIDRKARAVDMPQATRGQRIERFHELLRATEALRPHIEAAREEVRRQIATYEAESRENEIAMARDYAFCLFPEEKLRAFFTHLIRE